MVPLSGINPLTLSRQIDLLTKHLKGLGKMDRENPLFEKIIPFIRDIPAGARTPEILELTCKRFALTPEELDELLKRKVVKNEFDTLVPKRGWLHDYIEYTRETEPPTVFHFFAGMVAIGTALARNVFFDMGPYQIYSNMCVVIVAPSGKCRKTSACNIAVGLLRAVGCNVLAEKITPEALVSAFEVGASAVGLVYAPELAVFLGKQKYQEGMVPLLTRLFEAPKIWNSLTIMRGETTLTNVAISFLACSTMDWIQTAIPRDAFGGGFMSRLLFVVQNDTPRSYPIPPAMNPVVEHSLKARLLEFGKLRGKFTMTEDATEWHHRWYNRRGEGMSAEKQFAGYLERKPDQLKRIAMILTIAELQIDKYVELVLTKEKLEQALAIIDWVEAWLPNTFEQMSQSPIGEEHARMIKQLKNRQGVMDHSTWLRLNSNRMNGRTFKEATDTLRAAKLIDFDQNNRTYYLTPEGWGR